MTHTSTEYTPPHYILEESNFNCRHVKLCDLDIPRNEMAKLFAKREDPDQMLYNASSDLNLHCLKFSILNWVSQLLCIEEEDKVSNLHLTRVFRLFGR